MPLIIHLISGSSYLVTGETNPLDERGRMIRTVNLQSSRAMVIRKSAVAMCEVWPLDAYNAEQKARVDAEAEARAAGLKRNPNPGRDARLVVPR